MQVPSWSKKENEEVIMSRYRGAHSSTGKCPSGHSHAPRSPRSALHWPVHKPSQTISPRSHAGRLLQQRFGERPLGLTQHRGHDATLDCCLDLDLVSAAVLAGGRSSMLNCSSWGEKQPAERSRGSRKHKRGTGAWYELWASVLDRCKLSAKPEGQRVRQ